MRHAFSRSAFMAVVWCCLLISARAQPPGHSNDAAALELLAQAREFLSVAQVIQADITQTMIGTNERGRMEIQQQFKLAALRPNRLNLVTSLAQSKLIIDGEVAPPVEDDKQFRLVSDGERLYSFSEQQSNRYTSDSAPRNLGGAFDRWDELAEIGQPSELGLVWLLLFGAQFPSDDAVVAQAKLVGVEEIDGRATSRLHFVLNPKREADNVPVPRPYVLSPRARSVESDVWIDRGDQPLIRKIQTTFVPFAHMFKQVLADTKFENVTTFDNWRLNEPAPTGSFAFGPPREAKEAVSLIVTGSGWPLIGNPLSPFDLELLDGGRLNTALQKGRIMVLVFWNGVNEAGSGALPVILHFASRYEDRGVSLYLVNARDSDEALLQFLKEQQWRISVARDRDGSISRQYVGDSPGRAAALVIGQDGTIQAVHGDYFQDAIRLRAELEALIAGKKIIEEEVEPEWPDD